MATCVTFYSSYGERCSKHLAAYLQVQHTQDNISIHLVLLIAPLCSAARR